MVAAERIAAAGDLDRAGITQQRQQHLLGQPVEPLLLGLVGEDRLLAAGGAGEVAGAVVREEQAPRPVPHHHPALGQDGTVLGVGDLFPPRQLTARDLGAEGPAAVAIVAVEHGPADLLGGSRVPQGLGRRGLDVADGSRHPGVAAGVGGAVGAGLQHLERARAEAILEPGFGGLELPGTFRRRQCRQPLSIEVALVEADRTPRMLGRLGLPPEKKGSAARQHVQEAGPAVAPRCPGEEPLGLDRTIREQAFQQLVAEALGLGHLLAGQSGLAADPGIAVGGGPDGQHRRAHRPFLGGEGPGPCRCFEDRRHPGPALAATRRPEPFAPRTVQPMSSCGRSCKDRGP